MDVLPSHIGMPEQIGIVDLARPDYGDAVPVRDGELPVFWACGVTPQGGDRPREARVLHHPRLGQPVGHRSSKAALTSCNLSTTDAQAHPTWSKFVGEVGADPWDACKSDSSGLGSMGERIALAYDATDAYLKAVSSLDTDGIPVSPPAVWERLGALHTFDGISGLVDFHDGRVQNDHWIALMAVNHVNDPPDDPSDTARVVFHCGWANSEAMQHTSRCSA